MIDLPNGKSYYGITSRAERVRREESPHSRAMLGKKHTPQAIAKIKQASTLMWAKRKEAKNGPSTISG